MKFLNLLFLIVFIYFSFGCNQYQQNDQGFVDLAAAEKASCYYNLDSKGQLIAWPANSFVNFHFAADFPEAYKDRLREVASVWKNSRGESIIKFSNSPRSSSSSQSDGLNIIYWVDDASRFQTNEQGRTIVRSRNSQIIDADIMVNADSFEYFIDPPSNGIKVHAPSLMVHEFGHALGLRHIPFQESLMYSHLGFMQIRVEPQEIDKTALRCKY